MQYADEIVLWRAIKNNEDCKALQQDLDRLEEWCKETGLEINPGKSQHLRISNKTKKVEIPSGSYTINNKVILTENEAECLGVKISSKMDWTAQVNKVTAKCRQTLYVINGFFPKRYGAVTQLLFSSLVRSVADYASPCWFFSTKKLQRQLESIQKNFSQSIRPSRADKEDQSHDPDFSRYLQDLREVEWKPLWHRRYEKILETTYKI
ncbi:hypothetical protein RvY_10796 [Ramazzottius varieornatus]|uniref:Reverse transcriptase domain-containing protein n=1 Tax=Ramazzottius varieornatus TaxID=947166 RepID=A0A1D1VDY8_RAMVA|nr:hypothetical protein RvY_10796 [Ramazzottius varieornatus]